MFQGMMTKQTTKSTAKSQSNQLRWALIGSILVIITCLGEAAEAQSDSDEEAGRFHLRFGVGLVFTAEAMENENAPVTYSTAPGILDGVQLGGRLGKNFTLFFEADSLVMFHGEQPNDSGNTLVNHNNDETTYGFLTGMGAGFKVLPSDVYLSGALGAALSGVTVGGEAGAISDARPGIGFSTMLSKNWWSSNGTTLGIGGQFLYMATQGDNTNALNTHTLALGALLVTSFN